MKNLSRFAAVSLTLAATLIPWSAAEAQTPTNLTIDRDAQFLDSNEILITGTVPCRFGAEVFLRVTISQNAGGQNGVIGGTGFPDPFTCLITGPQSYSVSATVFVGLTFHKGKAHVNAEAQICTLIFTGEEFCTGEFNAADVQVSK